MKRVIAGLIIAWQLAGPFACCCLFAGPVPAGAGEGHCAAASQNAPSCHAARAATAKEPRGAFIDRACRCGDRQDDSDLGTVVNPLEEKHNASNYSLVSAQTLLPERPLPATFASKGSSLPPPDWLAPVRSHLCIYLI